MTPSDKCYAIIKNFERYRPTAYLPTRKDRWTCGWGHTEGVTESTTCDYATAQAWLEDDVSEAVAVVNGAVKVPLTQNQFDALVSFCFNIEAPFEPGQKFITLLNARNYAGAAADMLNWDHQAGTEIPGLENRREQERALFLAP